MVVRPEAPVTFDNKSNPAASVKVPRAWLNVGVETLNGKALYSPAPGGELSTGQLKL
jgi:hypothetical protein